MSEEASIFDRVDQIEEARALEQARAEIASGQGIPHSDVIEWLGSWGTEHELPCPVPASKRS
jgi:predicted transcriptional regulator